MARHLFWHIDPWLYRVTRGRYPAILGGLSSAPLISTGAKSGQPREHQLAYFHDGSDAILVASYLGEPKNPQWYHNLKAHPPCQLGDENFVAVEVTDPDDYERLYALAEHCLRQLRRLPCQGRRGRATDSGNSPPAVSAR